MALVCDPPAVRDVNLVGGGGESGSDEVGIRAAAVSRDEAGAAVGLPRANDTVRADRGRSVSVAGRIASLLPGVDLGQRHKCWDHCQLRVCTKQRASVTGCVAERPGLARLEPELI